MKNSQYLKILLIVVFSTLPLASQAKVRIFGGKQINENSALLVKSYSIRNLRACLWMLDEEHASACRDLYVRVSQDKTRAKIYLPSVDKDTRAKLVVTSGPYAADEQEFLIFIKDVIDPKKDFLSHFKFFTKKSGEQKYSLSVKRQDETSYSQPAKPALSENMYKAQNLTFQLKEKIRKRRKHREEETRNRKPNFKDLFRLQPRHLPPVSPSLGDIFVSDTNALCIFMDNKWIKIVGSGSCVPKDMKEPSLPKPVAQPKLFI